MRPKAQEANPQEDLFREKLTNLINLRHPLCRLAELIAWNELNERFGALYTQKEGRPGIATRLMAGLQYLKHAYNLSDEAVVERWVENPYWQHFCGVEYFQHQLPIDPSQLTRYRKRIGAEGCEYLLKATLGAGVSIPRQECGGFELRGAQAAKTFLAVDFFALCRLRFSMRAIEPLRSNLRLTKNDFFRDDSLLSCGVWVGAVCNRDFEQVAITCRNSDGGVAPYRLVAAPVVAGCKQKGR